MHFLVEFYVSLLTLSLCFVVLIFPEGYAEENFRLQVQEEWNLTKSISEWTSINGKQEVEGMRKS